MNDEQQQKQFKCSKCGHIETISSAKGSNVNTKPIDPPLHCGIKMDLVPPHNISKGPNLGFVPDENAYLKNNPKKVDTKEIGAQIIPVDIPSDKLYMLVNNPLDFQEDFLDKIPLEEILGLMTQAQKILIQQPTVIDLDETWSDLAVIGDLHGDLASLSRILEHFHKGDLVRLVFLGDYVDRGKFSLQTLSVILALIILYPDRVVALKGNHEDLEVNKRYGFTADLEHLFPDISVQAQLSEALDLLYDSFSVAAITPKRSLCVHGGVPKINSVDEVRTITKPYGLLMMNENIEDDILDQYVRILFQIQWNDPREDQDIEFEESWRSKKAYTFNEKATITFLNNSGLNRVIRAHEARRGGFQNLFGGKLLHVFTAEPYGGKIEKGHLIHEMPDKMVVRDLDMNIAYHIET